MASRILRTVEALATPHGLDRYLELVHPMLTVHDLRARITRIEHPTADSVTLTLRPTRQWRGFDAGQYVQLSVDIDGVRRTRCFSPATSARGKDGSFELTVKAHPEGLVSQHLKHRSRRGDVVRLAPAAGSFTLPSQRPDRVLFISGGSGITPVMSMLRTLCDDAFGGDITFLHYADTAADVAYLTQLRALAAAHDNVRLVLAYTRARSGGDLHGMFDEAHLAEAAPWYADAHTYLCGPPTLMQAVRAHYADKGLDGQLHSEEFVLGSVPATGGDSAEGEVSFARSGTSAENSGASLLEQAEAAGLDPDYGCRMGICFTCTATKLTGCTRNVRDGSTNSDPDTEVQLCINVPVGDVALDL